jgi:hypothetical protein
VTPLLFALLQDTEPQSEPPPPPPAVAQPAPPPPPEPTPPPMSEGRMLVHLRESGFQWGISPGVVFVNGDPGFALGAHVGYGFDLDSVILVPGIRLAGYFTDPSMYLGMPDFKLAVPIDRFEPFIEGGVGVGHVSDHGTEPAKTGVALFGGGGFLIHFRPIAFGVEANYLTITGSKFHGIGLGPILAIGL